MIDLRPVEHRQGRVKMEVHFDGGDRLELECIVPLAVLDDVVRTLVSAAAKTRAKVAQ